MAIAEISDVQYPAESEVGERVIIHAQLTNNGTIETLLTARLEFVEPANMADKFTLEVMVKPGSWVRRYWDFDMPAATVKFKISAWYWNAAFGDFLRGPESVVHVINLPDGGPNLALDQISAPGYVDAGDLLEVTADIQNNGAASMLVVGYLEFAKPAGRAGMWTSAVTLNPGATKGVVWFFNMPASDVELKVSAWYWDPSYGDYLRGPTSQIRTVRLPASEPRAAITAYSVTPAAGPGDRVTARVSARNVGGRLGAFVAVAFWDTDAGEVEDLGDWYWPDVGEEVGWAFTFTMPASQKTDLKVRMDVHHYSDAVGDSVVDDSTPVLTVKNESIAALYVGIIGYLIPAGARAGSQVDVSVTLMNGGGSACLARAAIGVWYSAAATILKGDPKTLQSNGSYTWRFQFDMPAASTKVMIESEHLDPSSGNWIQDDRTPQKTVKLYAGDWIESHKAAAVRDALEPGSLAVDLYEWLASLGATVPRGLFDPAVWIERTFDDAQDQINVLGKLTEGTQDTIADVLSQVKAAHDAAIAAEVTARNEAQKAEDSAWQKVVNAFDSVGLAIGTTIDTLLGPLMFPIFDRQADQERDIGILRAWSEAISDSIRALDPITEHIPVIDEITDFYEAASRNGYKFFSSPIEWLFDTLDDWLDQPA